jgi:acylphosphatase
MKKVRAIVSGRVQGVWYRAHTRAQAVELGIVGFVRNLPDGTVEIVAQGEDAQVDTLMDWARIGPRMAEVTDVRVREMAEDEEFDSFEVVP